MATSGSKSVEVIPGISMELRWSASIYIYNNYSNITFDIYLTSDGTASIVDAGTRYFSLRLSIGATDNGNGMITGGGTPPPLPSIDLAVGKTKLIHSYTFKNIKHNNNGTPPSVTCTATCDFGEINGITVGEKSVSLSVSLDQILRPVEISVSGNVLGSQSTIAVSRYIDTLTHTITWSCGGNSGTICEKAKTISEVFTPPIDFSSVNTAGTTVAIIFSVTTYNGDTIVGTRTYNIAYSIPESVAPSCTFTIADALLAKYGAHVQNKSTLRIVTTPMIAYDSPIVSYRVVVDGGVYTESDVTTAAIKTAGQFAVTVTVTDARGRSGTATETITVLAYTPPAVVSFAAERVNADGSDNEQGEYVKAIFSAAVTPLNDKNSAVYKLEYKKIANLGYTALDVSDQNGVYTPTDISRIFAADTGSSYDVRLTITDDFHTTVYVGKAQSGFTIFHVPASGHGFSFGKVSEVEGLFDVAFIARFLGGFMQPELEAGTDFDDVTVPNTYDCLDAATAGYLNCPVESGVGALDVKSLGGGAIAQTFISQEDGDPLQLFRCSVNDAWTAWSSLGVKLVYTDNSAGGQTVTIGE